MKRNELREIIKEVMIQEKAVSNDALLKAYDKINYFHDKLRPYTLGTNASDKNDIEKIANGLEDAVINIKDFLKILDKLRKKYTIVLDVEKNLFDETAFNNIINSKIFKNIILSHTLKLLNDKYNIKIETEASNKNELNELVKLLHKTFFTRPVIMQSKI